MDTETTATIATLAQMMHQLTHLTENTKSFALKAAVNPLTTSIRDALSTLTGFPATP